MSSILTNNSAMVALDTLRNINRSLSQVQSEISTGKKVATAKDNPSIWAISTIMSTDVSSFKQITDSLNLGSSTVGVARAASEQITDMLQEMKNLIVAAQEENVDRTKIQVDVDELESQITSIVNSAQFNGEHLLRNGGSISILSSLDRASDQSVSASYITVNRVDLQTTGGTFGTTGITSGNAGFVAVSGGTIAAAGSETVTLTAGAVAEGDSFQIVIGGTDTIEYIARANDTLNDVTRNLKSLIDAEGITGISVDITQVADPTATDSVLTINNANVGGVTLASTSFSGGTAGGGLAELAGIDVTTTAGANSALNEIEGLLQTAINAAASFGSSQKRIGNQVEFVQTLTDAFTSGIGSLVDSDIEAASARLQALQVQQQLGVQALSIANQQPQSLLSLFR